VFASARTDVGLNAGLAAERFWLGVSGTVELPPGKSALVVLESNGRVYSAVTDASGAFRMFNVTPGSGYTVQANVKGANYTPVALTVPASGADVSAVRISRAGDASATLSGTAQLLAGATGAGISVVMVVESTFHDTLIRGEVPPGLRTPDPGMAPTVNGAFSISEVPDGNYVVLAAFENDGNVQSPSFKVKGAIQMVSPGAGDETELVAFPPRFSWKPYAGAHSYAVRLFDSQGSQVWQNLAVDAGARDSAGDVEAVHTGRALIRGITYQWRATALDSANNPISSTEDLRGLFSVR
jgi:hypothetical protein